jgi:hypothetical protein
MYIRANNLYDLPVSGGRRVWFSGWVRSSGSYPTDYGHFDLYFVDAAGATSGGTGGSGTYFGSGSAWVFVTYSAIAPAGAVRAVFGIGFTVGSSSAGWVEWTGLKLSYSEPSATNGAQAGVNLVDSTGAGLGDNAIRNAAVTMGANGALAGAGGGQVLYDSLSGDTTYKRLLAAESSGGVHVLRVAGSGKRLADQRNLPAVLAMNLGSKYTGAVTYGATAGTPATATISVAAGSMLLGSVSVSYSAMSANVSGTGGTSATYYLYADDATYSGGALTLVATTTGNDVFGADGRVYFGYCTVAFPSSGSGGGDGGGGGGGGYCVESTSWMPDSRQARDYVSGDAIKILDEEAWDRAAYGLVESSEQIHYQPCVRLISESGISVVVSLTTPCTTKEGHIVYAPDSRGHELPVEDSEGFRWERIVEVHLAGLRTVSRIRCHGRTYAAGEYIGRFIYTHNPEKP